MKRTLSGSFSPEKKSVFVNGFSFFKMSDPLSENNETLQLLDGGTGINFEQLFGDFYETDQKLSSGYKRSTLNNVIKNYYHNDKLNSEEKKLRTLITEKLFEKCGMKNYSPGCFPPGILLGATWNTEAVYRTGLALGMEALVFGVDILLGTPNINIHRDPLAGRLFEGYSEDPFLVSRLAPYLVKGVQEYGVAANVKHFAANNQESFRVGINEIISRRALEELYLPGFKACMTNGSAVTIMSAYNSINGVPCTENTFLLKEKLRNEWKSDAAVISDWGAVKNQVLSLKAGNNLKMPGPSENSEVTEAVKSGILSEAELDDSVDKLIFMSSWIKKNSKKEDVRSSDYTDIREYTEKAAYYAAAEGIVLLENDGTLPLKIKNRWKFSVAGSGAEHFLCCGEGSAGVITDRFTDFAQSLLRNFPDSEICDNYLAADVVFVICTIEGREGNDRKDLNLKKEDLMLLRRLGCLGKTPDISHGSSYKKIILILNICGPVDLSEIDMNTVNAVLCPFIPGMQGPLVLADIISGKVNPSGRLPLCFPEKYEDCPSFLNFPGDGKNVVYGEGIFNGYRYYDLKKIKPKYYFGYGLSFSEFKIGKIENLSVNDYISFDLNIINCGDMSGSQVVQIYISDPFSTIRKPYKELKAFRKVYLEAGEEKTIHFDISTDLLRSFDENLEKWTLEEGFYDIIASDSSDPSSCADIKRFYLDIESPYSFGLNSSVKTIFENPELRNIFVDFWKSMGWDSSVYESCYQYTPSRLLNELINDVCIPDTEISEKLNNLVRKMKMIKKM